ncbi:MAG: tRNA pseudouridine(55) synthase TruB [Clostridiales Family XIII bacterium]|jgi:tRNA pseudouridine55 synthase|nr:tRNA pseudouridine(55) synthase TruB [Clostridiales Family XIII bacterium]
MVNSLSGIINFNKPQGITSHDAVYLIRKYTGIKKVGHTGTLDPMATGVLPICIGKATRIIEYLDIDNRPDAKSYACEMTLGQTSDTYDIWGNILTKDSTIGLTEERIREVLMSFVGKIEQIPPMYSAIKVDGRKLYDYARSGDVIDLSKIKPRNVEISSLEINAIDLETAKVHFNMTCSKGTYVRSICHDAGQLLGCGGLMSGLKRTQSNGFTIETAYSEMDLIAIDDISSVLYPMDQALVGIPAIKLGSDSNDKIFINGGVIHLEDISETEPNGIHKIYTQDDQFVGMAMYKDGLVYPKKVIRG